YYKPFVDWVWGGCLLMALGGGLAATDRRYRVRQRRELPAAVAAAAAHRGGPPASAARVASDKPSPRTKRCHLGTNWMQ
ncbi:MAG TPA: hypothetical protein DCQ04_11770, partial [Actinobacteria bacterium]|nr:hypothetical protein [Actinomycetota bacterium]